MLTIEQAKNLQDRYSGKPEVREPLGSTSLTAFVGDLAVGKTFMMKASGLHVVGTETTRKPRPDDDPKLYRYSALESLLADIEAGELVQYGVSLPCDIYATRLQDYALDQPNVKDIWHDSVRALDNKGFEAVRSVSVFTPKKQWMSQLALRTDEMVIGLVERRLGEARHSMKWSLAHHLSRAANHLLIINTPYTVEKNVERIRAFSAGEYVELPHDDDVNDVMLEMFDAIDVMYKRLGVK